MTALHVYAHGGLYFPPSSRLYAVKCVIHTVSKGLIICWRSVVQEEIDCGLRNGCCEVSLILDQYVFITLCYSC